MTNKIKYARNRDVQVFYLDQYLNKFGRQPGGNRTVDNQQHKSVLLSIAKNDSLRVRAEYMGKTPQGLHAMKIKDVPIAIQKVKALIAQKAPKLDFNITNGSILTIKGTAEQLKSLVPQMQATT